MMSHKVFTGSPTPLGATSSLQGTNFAVSSGGDEVTLCLLDRDGTESQVVLADRDGDVWHGFVPGVRAGQAYGFRVSGPINPAQGPRYTPAKLLLNPCSFAHTILYEIHVRGFTATHPGVPPPLQGTYAALAHEAVLEH